MNSLSAVRDLISISFMTFFKSSIRSAVFEFPALPNEIQTRGIATPLTLTPNVRIFMCFLPNFQSVLSKDKSFFLFLRPKTIITNFMVK
ncbi:hypothetical protein RHT_01656 [Candidatus Rhabdochlamydia sp. T3358]|nr:hypothetical protein RHT_00955 [Candidatus Rhabdochlamydia sp. T3358]VHO05194.1 hypothetical protein RHT_01656 [Candidatus Rhabdochlamydia sp. T3358]